MASFSLETYSSSESSGEHDASTGRGGLAGREVGHIGESSISSLFTYLIYVDKA